ncbi:thioesterase [Ganoderma leucocontextum]|nr:thioesterase [Ganoderma leucocontextum]
MVEGDVKALRVRTRSDYAFFLSYRTRWTDNDQYSHINNSVYYHLFDSIVNTYLIQHAHLSPTTSSLIGLVVSSFSHFFSPLSFPALLDLGLRVSTLGSSSVTYEVAVFQEQSDTPSVVGGYTHVFVDRHSRKSSPIAPETRSALERLRSHGLGSKL